MAGMLLHADLHTDALIRACRPLPPGRRPSGNGLFRASTVLPTIIRPLFTTGLSEMNS